MNYKRTTLSCLISLALLSGCNLDNGSDNASSNSSSENSVVSKVPYYDDWPSISSAIPQDEDIEAFIADILSQMTLEEKVGQMIQPDLREVTPEEAKEYKLGSLLNGGGGWPNDDKYATAQDWADMADQYYDAVDEAYEERGFRIPFMWATDAVHGHNNVYRATVFPHNIGLGAANNPDLIERIGEATAEEIVATGLDWTFAPTVASPRDYRWGRVYEGYSEDPEIIYQYAGRMVEGLQGGAQGLKGERNVISNVKHWVGDGGTFNGEDRGENHYTEEYLRNIMATGYFSGLEAGAQVVMSSFNSWHNDANYDQTGTGEYNYKLHGSKYMLNDILKDKMGFDGLIVTDWNGQSEINGCTSANCPEAVNAGNDVFMVTSNSDWKAFYQNVIDQVDDGTISIDRIDDAVTRILRVKMRANLWEKPKPSQRELAGDESVLGSDEHRAIARQAVSESLVLLKNEGSVLPLSKNASYIIAGSAANDIQKQTGGWSITWQGTENTLEDDFPGATTMLMALQDVVGTENVYTSESEAPEDAIAIVVIGEDPYAEMYGDIDANQTLEFSSLDSTYAADLATVQEMKDAGHKVVTVFYSGRPLYVNEEINASDAFVAAWLPGTEAGGITDVLFAEDGADFKGRLSYSWPMNVCSTTINRHAPNIEDYTTPVDGMTGELIEQDIERENKPLFPYGYGLGYASSTTQGVETDLNDIPLDYRDYGCGQSEPDSTTATSVLELYNAKASGDYTARMAGETNGWSSVNVSNGTETSIGTLTTTPINYLFQQDALKLEFSGVTDDYPDSSAEIFIELSNGDEYTDLNSYINAEATLQFDVQMLSEAPESMILATDCGYPCRGSVDIWRVLPDVRVDGDAEWDTVKIPLTCFEDEGMSFSLTDKPFLLQSGDAVSMNLGNIRYVPLSEDAAEDAVSCEELVGEGLTPLDLDEVNVFDTWTGLSDYQATTDDWSSIDGHVTYSTEMIDGETILSVAYDSTSPESYKGIVYIDGNTQNLSNYVDGTLNFDLLIETYGTPANDGENETTGLTIKLESEDGGTGDDYLLSRENYPTGTLHNISINVSELNDGTLDIEAVNRALAILPSWGQSQAGVEFKVKNLTLIK
ncbi:glycoside hydrolase family 3 N-terminal domain-containing protein [Vibrio sp. WJH972]